MLPYIHVSDLAAIHVAALRGLENGAPGRVFNCGSGRGVSVGEVLAAVRAEAGVAFCVRNGPRRPGDPPVLVADTARLRAIVAKRARLGESPRTRGSGRCLSPGAGRSTRPCSAWRGAPCWWLRKSART